MARIRGASKARARTRTEELLAALDIEEWASKRGQNLSGGVKRLTAFAMAAAEPGRLVMFDEPTNDVDPVRRRLLWGEIRKLAAADRAVVLVTHNVVEAERAVENLAILDKGQVIAHGTPAELRGDHRDELRLELVALDQSTATDAAARFDNVGEPVIAGRRAVVPIDASQSPAAIERARGLQESELIEEFSITPVSLEDVYIRLVGPEANLIEGTHDATVAA
jgi:ABC-2 type transport system ATP-binding protein